MKQKTLFIVSAIVLLLVFAAGAFFYSGKKQEEATKAVQQSESNLVRMHSPTHGPADAKVLIVEFFDPACGTCRDFYPLVKEIMDAHPGRVRLAMRYAPFHDGSYEVVKLLEASRKQNKYWETLEALFSTQDYWTINHKVVMDRVWEALSVPGLNVDQLKQDMNAPEITAVIEQDMADIKALNITMTPEFFVNSKPMPSFGEEQLRTLVSDAIAESYK